MIKWVMCELNHYMTKNPTNLQKVQIQGSERRRKIKGGCVKCVNRRNKEKAGIQNEYHFKKLPLSYGTVVQW